MWMNKVFFCLFKNTPPPPPPPKNENKEAAHESLYKPTQWKSVFIKVGSHDSKLHVFVEKIYKEYILFVFAIKSSQTLGLNLYHIFQTCTQQFIFKSRYELI